MGKKVSKTKKSKERKKVGLGARIVNRVKKFVTGPWTKNKIIISVICLLIVASVVSDIWSYCDAVMGLRDVKATINDPMISKDLLGMKFKYSSIWGAGGASGPRRNPSVSNDFDFPDDGASHREVFNRLVAETKKNDWRNIELYEDEFDNFKLTATKTTEKYVFSLNIKVGQYGVTVKVLRKP